MAKHKVAGYAEGLRIHRHVQVTAADAAGGDLQHDLVGRRRRVRPVADAQRLTDGIEDDGLHALSSFSTIKWRRIGNHGASQRLEIIPQMPVRA